MVNITLLFILFSILSIVQSTFVNISNVEPRRDVNGIIMDIHDGNVLLYNGLYYWYGASYGLCEEPNGTNGCSDFGLGNCGFRLDHNISLYTSPDLATWTFQGHIWEMANAPFNAILFCPKVIYNAKYDRFVLWFNWISPNGFSESFYAVAVSESPMGPFKLVSQNVTTLAFEDTGDFNLFVDDDGSAYVIYTSHIQGYSITHRMSVEKLTDDYTATLGSSANSGFFGDSFVEAPAYFKRDNLYYAVFGQCCCYCGGGSPVVSYVASNPMGPYSTQNTITQAIPAQQTNIAPFNTPNGVEYMWVGDRWQSAPDHIKGHDFTYWGVLNFDDSGNVLPLPFLDSFQVNVIEN